VDYQIEADWKLLGACNFRCPYCFIPVEELAGKVRRFASPADWRRAFDETGKIWLLHLTGGEPSVYTDFAPLCDELTRAHYISLNSNLTNASLTRFAERIDPKRVSFINAGLHLEERGSRVGHAAFLRHGALLRSKGFPIFVSLVATPGALDRFDAAVALLAPIGLFPIPKLLRETFEGRTYPEAYTVQEKAAFRVFAIRARDFYEPMMRHREERPSIDVFGDDYFLDGTPSYSGRPCEAGRLFVSIDPNGDVFRCSPQTRLGNVLEHSFKPLTGPAPCDTSYCFYFCEKYAAAHQQPDL
jgi:MoaA/NifB/PqqE/SkfB family radical SAM enzyme